MADESSPVTSQLPRKKPNILWWLGGIFFLLVCLFLYQVFGPDPPIIVSRQTTFVTSPLRDDGLPDYEQYLLDRYRDGVTPENNAAVLLWQALWPGELDPKHYAAVAQEIGLEQIPSQEDALVELHDERMQSRVRKWLVKQSAKSADSTSDAESATDEVAADEAAIEDLLVDSMSVPWTSDQIPPLAAWVKDNQKPLDLIVEASRRSRYSSPSPTLLDKVQDSLFQLLLPDIQAVRGAARSLATRAMWHLGEGRLMEAWRDLLAIHRLGRLVNQGQTLVEKLVGIAIDGIACAGTHALLHHGKLSAEQLEQIRRALDDLPHFASMAEGIGKTERVAFIDGVLGLGGRAELALDEIGVDNQVQYMNVVAINWNVALRIGNEFFDRYEQAAKLPPGPARRQALAKIEADLQQLVAGGRDTSNLVAGILSRGARSNFVASMMVGLLLPAVQAALNAEDRANTMCDLTRLAAALASYRVKHNQYPEKLDELLSSVLDELPADVYNAAPYHYKRTDDGFLLYSAGENGTDDGGSNEQQSLFEGRSLDKIERVEMTDAEDGPTIPPGADDMPIRLPGPTSNLLPKPLWPLQP